MILDRMVTTVTLDHNVATMTLDTIVAFTIVAFVVRLVALLSSPVMWRKEHIWNGCVLRRVHVSNLV
jgi:hypothetical protein